MATVIRPVISDKKEYHISKERYYELKHFCLQYPEWKKVYAETEGGFYPKGIVLHRGDSYEIEDLTAELAICRSEIRSKMKLIEDCARSVDPSIGNYILRAVTEGRSFTNLSVTMQIPCGKDLFYDRYRKFFWLLDKKRM